MQALKANGLTNIEVNKEPWIIGSSEKNEVDQLGEQAKEEGILAINTQPLDIRGYRAFLSINIWHHSDLKYEIKYEYLD